jgi:hypothetical protein
MHVKHVRRVQSFLFSFSITNFPPYRHMWPRQGTHVQIEIFFVQAKGAYLYDIFRKVFHTKSCLVLFNHSIVSYTFCQMH